MKLIVKQQNIEDLFYIFNDDWFYELTFYFNNEDFPNNHMLSFFKPNSNILDNQDFLTFFNQVESLYSQFSTTQFLIYDKHNKLNFDNTFLNMYPKTIVLDNNNNNLIFTITFENLEEEE